MTCLRVAQSSTREGDTSPWWASTDCTRPRLTPAVPSNISTWSQQPLLLHLTTDLSKPYLNKFRRQPVGSISDVVIFCQACDTLGQPGVNPPGRKNESINNF